MQEHKFSTELYCKLSFPLPQSHLCELALGILLQFNSLLSHISNILFSQADKPTVMTPVVSMSTLTYYLHFFYMYEFPMV